MHPLGTSDYDYANSSRSSSRLKIAGVKARLNRTWYGYWKDFTHFLLLSMQTGFGLSHRASVLHRRISAPSSQYPSLHMYVTVETQVNGGLPSISPFSIDTGSVQGATEVIGKSITQLLHVKFYIHWRILAWRQEHPSLGLNSLILMQFSAHNLQNNRVAHPLWEFSLPSGKSCIRHWYNLSSLLPPLKFRLNPGSAVKFFGALTSPFINFQHQTGYT